MGFVTCGTHKGVRCCWGCDRCPREYPQFRLGKGDYCPDCHKEARRRGFAWCDFCQNYHNDGTPAHDKAGRIIEPAPSLGFEDELRDAQKGK